MTMTHSQIKKDNCQSWIYLSFISLITFFVFGFLDTYGVLLVFLVHHFNERNSKAAWVGSSATFGCLFLYPFALRFRYKFGLRTTVLFAGALLLPVFIFSPMVKNMNLLFLTFSVPVAISCSIISVVTLTTITECFDRHQGVAFGIRSTLNALGTVMFSLVLPVMLNDFGWRTAFWVLSGISLITFFYGFLYNDRESKDGYPSERVCSVSTVISLPSKDFSKDDLLIYRKILQDKKVIVFLAAHTIFAIVIFLPPMFMVQFATNLGHPLHQSKWLMITRGIVAVLVRSVAGRFGDLASRKRKVRLLILSVMTLFTVATVLCSFTHSFVLMMLYMAFISVMDSVYWVVLPLHVAEIVKGWHTEHAFALFSCVGSFATLGGPPFLGWIYDTMNDPSPVMHVASAIATVAVCLAAAVLYLSKDDNLSVCVSEELVNDVFIDEDFPTQTTVVYLPESKMQYITVV